jgi:very-short-patch-repair endonuclease
MTGPAPTYHTSTDRRCKVSALEQRVLDDLVAAGLPIVPQVKRRSWVFDAAVAGTWILIEVNGDYWHAKPDHQARDARKAAWCAQFGYILITIAEGAYLKDPAAAVAPVIAAYRAVTQQSPQQSSLSPDSEVPFVSGDRLSQQYAVSSEVIPGPGDWAGPFLAQLSTTGIVLDACRAAGVSRTTAYARRESDALFKQGWQYAMQDAADVAMLVYRQRGMEQSDRAMEFFLKSRDPETYTSDGVNINIQIEWSLVPDALLDAFRLGKVTFDELKPYAAQSLN